MREDGIGGNGGQSACCYDGNNGGTGGTGGARSFLGFSVGGGGGGGGNAVSGDGYGAGGGGGGGNGDGVGTIRFSGGKGSDGVVIIDW